MWEEKRDNWPKVNKDWEEVPCINDLTASVLGSFSLGRTPTPFLSGCVSLPCSVLNKRLFPCVFSHLLRCVSHNELHLFLQVFASLRNSFFTQGKSQGNFASSLEPLVV